MNSLAQVLLWCPVQVTVLALAALGIGTIAGRRRPAAGALVAVAALLAVVGLTATALANLGDLLGSLALDPRDRGKRSKN
jgi:hypothetical protein